MTFHVSAAGQKLVVVYNPAAGQRRKRLFMATLAALRDIGFRLELLETRGPGDATRLARMVAERADAPFALVVAGGDGTINEAVNGLAGHALPLAVIPLGTANVLALELGLARDPLGIAATVAAGRRREIRLGLVESVLGRRHFVMMAGVGYDAHVVAGVSPRWKRRLGKLAYVAEMFLQLARFHFTPYTLAFDDGAPVAAASAILANGRHYGGPFVCAPEADLGADRLDACVFRHGGRLAAVKYGVALGLDRVPRLASIDQRPFRRLTIDGPAGDPVQGDGDIVARLPATITLARDRVVVITAA
ncbi:MAG: diacylglycerol kinase family protein [Zavarzinia sp.]|nr:diacylglycerol kinase family protein [Zavarzinia sp.]